MQLLQTTISAPTPPNDPKWLKVFWDALNKVWGQLAIIINGGISFGDGTARGNIDGVLVTATTVAGNFTVTHGLNRTPVGYWMVKSDAFENLKFVSSTASQITLAGQNGGAHITLFVF